MNFDGVKVTVIGDIMLDHYFLGEANELAQEAPVVSFRQDNLKVHLGAAANVALNARRLGAEVELIGVIGEDKDGDDVCSLCDAEGIKPQLVVEQLTFTNVKVRYCDTRTYHQLFRSNIVERPPNEGTKALLIEEVKRAIQDTDVILISDYGKGVICHEVMECLKDLKGVFIGVDPHPSNRLYYGNCDADLFTPNEPEAIAMGWSVGQAFWGPGDYLMVTRGKAGMYARNAQENTELQLPAHTLHPICVVGAGDVVVTVGSLCLNAGLSLDKATELANHAAGNAVRRPFTSTIFPYDLKLDEEPSLTDQGV